MLVAQIMVMEGGSMLVAKQMVEVHGRVGM
jgi:hypothetical protein